MHSFSSLYNENTVISKEYPGPFDFDITGVDCIFKSKYVYVQTLTGMADNSSPDNSSPDNLSRTIRRQTIRRMDNSSHGQFVAWTIRRIEN